MHLNELIAIIFTLKTNRVEGYSRLSPPWIRHCGRLLWQKGDLTQH